MTTRLKIASSLPLQYSCLENPMDERAWWAAVPGVAKSWTRLSDFTFTFHFHVLEKEMATHSSVLVWRIPGTAEPGGLLSKGSHRVRHDSSDLAAAACHIYKTYLFPKLLNNLTLLKISNSSFCWLFWILHLCLITSIPYFLLKPTFKVKFCKETCFKDKASSYVYIF